MAYETTLRVIKFVTVIPPIVIAGYYFLIQKSLMVGLIFVGISIFYWFFMTREPLHPTLENKKTAIATRIAMAWMFIVMWVGTIFIGTSSRQIWMIMVPAPLVLLLIWMALTTELIEKGSPR
ncbi:MAG: hypothetical protein HXS44_04300 [Theionarchaea archaeon]|nr:hypothetical protein [Theionarchaea archaeon]